MEFLDMNFSEINDTSNNLSEFSFSPDQKTKQIQDGGFFWSDNGPNKVDKSIIEAARLKKNDIVEFMIDNDLMTSYKSQDDSGNTVLHYLIMNSNPNTQLIEKILNRPDVKSFINLQNKDGDTVLILCVVSGHHDLCTKLIEKGADKEKKNKKGLHVDTETELEETTVKPNVTIQEFNLMSNSPNKTNSDLDAQIKEILNPFFAGLKGQKKNMLTSEPMSMSNNLGTEKLTPEFIEKMKKEFSNSNILSDIQNKLSNNPMSDSQKTIDLINGYLGKTQSPSMQLGGGCGCGSGSQADTENLFHDIEKYFDKQKGGKNNKINGKRKLNKENYSTKNKEYSDDSDNEETDRGAELNRIINNQTSEIINRGIKKIQSIIVENKKDFKNVKPDEETAKAYKAALWSSVKEKNPNLKSPLDIAIEMEKMITKDSLKNINVNEWIDKLKTHYKEKEQGNKKSKNKNDDRDTISATSSEEVPSEQSISETSMSIN